MENTTYRIYNLETRLIMWSEDCSQERIRELNLLGYGVTELIVTEMWAKPTLTEDSTSVYNVATEEEQAIYESQFTTGE